MHLVDKCLNYQRKIINHRNQAPKSYYMQLPAKNMRFLFRVAPFDGTFIAKCTIYYRIIV